MNWREFPVRKQWKKANWYGSGAQAIRKHSFTIFGMIEQSPTIIQNQWPYANMLNRYQLLSGTASWGGGAYRGGDFALGGDRANLWTTYHCTNWLDMLGQAWHDSIGQQPSFRLSRR